jgi:putative ABC transport system ATP-binding protein
LTSSDPALEINGLSFGYGQEGAGGFRLRIGRFRVEPGEQVVLTGRSGSGKSTLLHLIAGLIDPEAGEVRVAGQAIHALRGHRRDQFRGRRIGMVFQTFNLLAGFSASENVQAALMFSTIPAHEHRARAAKLLETLGIDRPHQLAERLSVGQQQRVAVARALACGPALVLADEPTASLDPENADNAMKLLQGACRERGAALLCVSHDPAMPARFERVVSLDDLRGGAEGAAAAVGTGAGVEGGAAWR